MNSKQNLFKFWFIIIIFSLSDFRILMLIFLICDTLTKKYQLLHYDGYLDMYHGKFTVFIKVPWKTM